MKQIISLDPTAYVRHRIHSQERDWAETNCYVDVLIELVHALGHEPLAAMPFTLAADFEGDQWTFFKFPLGDLYELYGLDVQELAPWQPLVEHIETQVGLGKPVLVELDSFYLPDTAGTAYKLEHVKSTVAITEIDIASRHMGYFHGQGYYHLDGDDFLDIFRMRGEVDPAILPPYIEFVKIRSNDGDKKNRVLETSLKLLRKQLDMLPETNPFERFKGQFEQDVKMLAEKDMDLFHKYSFVTLRQFGACFELSATYVDWLESQGETGISDAKQNLKRISELAKVYQFQLARALARKKPLDLTPVDQMGESWNIAMGILKNKYL